MRLSEYKRSERTSNLLQETKVVMRCVRSNFFCERVVNVWNSLPDDVSFDSFYRFRCSIMRIICLSTFGIVVGLVDFCFLLFILCVLLILSRLIRTTSSVYFVPCCPVLLSFYWSYLTCLNLINGDGDGKAGGDRSTSHPSRGRSSHRCCIEPSIRYALDELITHQLQMTTIVLSRLLISYNTYTFGRSAH